ncbi:MAG TPA: hypothetical protein VEB41_06180 [Burkholderiales bacterium]|nr:hypothetical protein [Burkholderiales bacterium]
MSAVPAWLWAALVCVLASQLAWHRLAVPEGSGSAADLPSPPRPAALRLAAFGEEPAAARVAMLYLQSFDVAGFLPERVIGWLQAALGLDRRAAYPLFSAARIYAEVPDAQRSRAMLQFIHREFQDDPNRRWPWLAHAALLAKHRLRDLPLARRYAADLERKVTATDVPMWATQMEIFILEDMNELEAARILLGGLLESGKVRDPGEARFLKERLDELERRSAGR